MTSVNFYDKKQTDDLLDTKADKSTTYNKSEVDNALALKANASTVYTKTEIDSTLDDYATKAYVNGKRTVTQLTTTADVLTALRNGSVGDELISNGFWGIYRASFKKTGSQWVGSALSAGSSPIVIIVAIEPIANDDTKIKVTQLDNYGGSSSTIERNISSSVFTTYVINYT